MGFALAGGSVAFRHGGFERMEMRIVQILRGKTNEEVFVAAEAIHRLSVIDTVSL